MCVIVITSLSVSAFAAGEQPTGSNYGYLTSSATTSYADYWSASNNNIKQIGLWLSNIRGSSFWYFDGTNTHGSDNFFNALTKSLYYIGYQLKNQPSSSSAWTTTDVQTVTSAITHLPTIYSELVAIENRLITGNSTLSLILSKLNDIKSDTGNLVNIKSYLSDLHDIFASPEDLALKNAQDQNVSSATTDFLSGTSSSTSIGVGDIGNVKTIGNDLSSNFDTGVSGMSLFGLIFDNSNDGPFSWFTQDTLDNLSPSSSRGNVRSSDKSGEYVVDFYADKMADLDRLLGEVAKND